MSFFVTWKRFLCFSLLSFVSIINVHSPLFAATPWVQSGDDISSTNSGNIGIGTDSPKNKLDVNGDIGLNGFLNFPDWRILPGGAFEWPGKLRVGRGGGEGDGLADWRGNVRAQPGSNLEIIPLKDYARSALDIYPTLGKKPDLDAFAELTLHRIHPTNKGHEMLSISALAKEQDKYAFVVEAHGVGNIKPLDFMIVQGGLLADDSEKKPFWAHVMRMKTDGTMQFGRMRTASNTEPVDIINIEQESAPIYVSNTKEALTSNKWEYAPGLADSHFLRFTAKEFEDKKTVNRADWRMNVKIDKEATSSYIIQSKANTEQYNEKMVVNDTGDVELPVEGSAVILTSPMGKRWRVTVDDDGNLKTSPAE